MLDSQTGRRITLAKAFIRTILKLLPWEIAHLAVVFPEPMYFTEEPLINPLIYIGIGLFVFYIYSILRDSRGRSVYDLLLSTEVVKSK